MTLSPFESPVAAATAGIPPHCIRILGVRETPDEAYVLFDGRPDGPPYEYGVVCYRNGGRWHEGNSSNGDGWTHTDPDGDLGLFTLWGVRRAARRASGSRSRPPSPRNR